MSRSKVERKKTMLTNTNQNYDSNQGHKINIIQNGF